MNTTRFAVPAALAALVAVGMSSCSRPGADNDFRWTTQLPPGAIVHIRDGAGEIRIGSSADRTVHVSGSRTWRRGHQRDVKFVVEQRGTDYYVCAMWSNSGSCGKGRYRGASTGGILTMFSLFHRHSDTRADFVAEVPADVIVDATTTNGSVEINGVRGGASAHAVNGTIRASGVAGPLNLSTINGDVRLDASSLSPSDSIHLSTTNGSVHAQLPASIDGAFDLSAVNGSVVSAVSLPAVSQSSVGRHLQGQIGSSVRPVYMRAINGTVDVTTR